MTCLLSFVLAAALALVLPAGPADAEFTFKRVRPPSSAGPRIDVQIDAETFRRQAAPSGAGRPGTPPAAAAGAASDHRAWFWSAVSPSIEPTPGRFTEAARLASQPPAGSGIARTHGREILRRSVGSRVSPALVLALIAVESGGRPTAVSPKGAQGLMQLIPATGARFGVTDANDPAENIRGGVAYLDWLMGQFGSDPVLALAGYNAGEGAVQRSGGVPPYAETRAYVPKVLAAWNVARQMCTTPPVLPGDGCVFSRALVES